MEKQRILIVDDDENIAELISLYLLKECFATEIAYNGRDAIKLASTFHPNLILLDIMLPEEDGLSVLKKLREHADTKEVPVIMLTAKDSEYDKVLGLDSGADDYVPKPFGIMELVARIKALLRRTENRADTTDDGEKLIAGSIALDTKRHIVLVDGERINLTLKEFELLHLFMENQGQVFTRDQLLNRIWGYEFDGESRTVDVHIRSLRMKLKEAGNMIETVRGVGYKIGD